MPKSVIFKTNNKQKLLFTRWFLYKLSSNFLYNIYIRKNPNFDQIIFARCTLTSLTQGKLEIFFIDLQNFNLTKYTVVIYNNLIMLSMK